MTTTHDLPAAAPRADHPADPSAAAPLSLLLREGTRPEHEAAEGSSFVEDLLGGRLTTAAYVDLALQLHAVYVALEEVGELVRRTPAGAGVVFDACRCGAGTAGQAGRCASASAANRARLCRKAARASSTTAARSASVRSSASTRARYRSLNGLGFGIEGKA